MNLFLLQDESRDKVRIYHRESLQLDMEQAHPTYKAERYIL
jgi:hypothetical protein